MPITEERLEELNIHPMVDKNTDAKGTAFTVSIDAKETTTGISAYERSLTINKVLDPNVRQKTLIGQVISFHWLLKVEF